MTVPGPGTYASSISGLAGADRLAPAPGHQPAPGHRLELWLVAAGRRTAEISGSVLRLRESTVCWIFPGQSHRVLSSSADLSGWRVMAGADVLDLARRATGGPVFRPPDPTGLPLVCRVNATDLRWLYERLGELHTGPTDPGDLTAGLAYVLLRAWRAALAAGADQQPASAVVLQAVGLLRQPVPDLPWSAKTLASSLGLSPGQLERRFRAETGQSVTQYRLRTQVSRYLDLCDDDHTLSITEAAYAAGFGSYAQFHRIFLRFMGDSPSRHRARRRRGLLNPTGTATFPADPLDGAPASP